MLLSMTISKRILILSTIILAAVQLAACGNATPMPTVTATTIVAPSLTSINPTTTIIHPTISPTSTATNKIRLYHNHIATRTTRDKYSFSVVVMDPAVDLTPISIQIVEQGTSVVIGHYELFDQTEIDSLCAASFQNPDFKIFETVLINYFDLPQGFIIRAYEDDFIFQLTIEHPSGVQEIVEKQTPARSCYQAVS